MRAIKTFGAIFGLVWMLAACGQAQPTESPQQTVARAVAAKPADAHLAQLYMSACHNCHGTPGANAPLALDRATWDPRWAKGEDTLLTHTISGFNGMPAGGQCFSCNANDYRALIRFMAGREE